MSAAIVALGARLHRLAVLRKRSGAGWGLAIMDRGQWNFVLRDAPYWRARQYARGLARRGIPLVSDDDLPRQSDPSGAAA